MARVHSKDTLPELRLRRALWALGLRYRLHGSLPGSPDIVFVRQRLCILVDGCFWHGCPEHYRRPATNVDFWTRKLMRNQERDRRVDVELAEAGWEVLHVWTHELKSHSRVSLIAAQIRSKLMHADAQMMLELTERPHRWSQAPRPSQELEASTEPIDDRADRVAALNRRLRLAFLEGAEEQSQRALGRPLDANELKHIAERYPGDIGTAFRKPTET